MERNCSVVSCLHERKLLHVQLSKDRLRGDSKPEDIILDTGVNLPTNVSQCGAINTVFYQSSY